VNGSGFYSETISFTMHLKSGLTKPMHTMLFSRPWVIQTWGRSFGELSCTALAWALLRRATNSSSALMLTSPLPLVLLP